MIKDSDKEKYAYSEYGIAFDSEGSWSFENDFDRNVLILFGVDKSSSYHSENCKNNFLYYVKNQLMASMEALDHQRKSLRLILLNQLQNFVCLSLHYNAANSCLFVNGKEVFEFKAANKNVNFPAHFCVWSTFNGFGESREVSLNGNVCDILVDYNSIGKSDKLNIHKYLIEKNNIK